MAKSKVDFAALLDRTSDQVIRPVAAPIGSYESLVKKFDLGESSQKGTPYVEVFFELLTVGEDVDPEEVAAIEGGIIGKIVKRKFYISPDAEYMLWEFLEEHIGLSSSGKNLKELLEEAINNTVGIYITHKPSEDGTKTFAEVKRTFKYEA